MRRHTSTPRASLEVVRSECVEAVQAYRTQTAENAQLRRLLELSNQDTIKAVMAAITLGVIMGIWIGVQLR
jgi:hypothetical protein